MGDRESVLASVDVGSEPAGNAAREAEGSASAHDASLRSGPTTVSAGALGRELEGLCARNWMLAVCVVCGHERVHGERPRATCPTPGASAKMTSALPCPAPP
jgi:hypothetical protein